MEPTFAEFFAGIGLVRAGLGAGWECLYANDLDPGKEGMYRSLFPDSDEFHLCDIWETGEIVSRVGSPTLATASFPCTDLSLAGGQRGLSGGGSGAFYGLILVLRGMSGDGRLPPVLMLENVHGLVTGNGGRDFRAVCSELRSLGYSLDAVSLDARHFTPQSRPRVFIIGVLDDPPADMVSGERADALCPPSLAAAMAADGEGWIGLRLPEPPGVRRSVMDVLDTGDGQDWWADADVRRHADSMSDAHRSRLAELAPTVATAFRRTRGGKVRLEVRFDGLAGCLRTPRGGSGRQIVVQAAAGGLRMRWMASSEYAALQGAPRCGGASERQALFGYGDAVCVPVISWLERNILSPLAGRL